MKTTKNRDRLRRVIGTAGISGSGSYS